MKRLIKDGIKVINIKYRNSMSLKEILEYRRSVRYFDEAKELDTEKVKHCIELATLAPNSSNMQLWEFYHITDLEMLKKISHACMDQKATEIR
jgi:nitroreductase